MTQDDDGGGAGAAGVQTGTSNAANETTAIGSTAAGMNWADPTYDAGGNMTSGPKGGLGSQTGTNQAELTRLHYVYDAWNRLVEAKVDAAGSPGAQLTRFEYDGLNRRIEKLTGGVKTDDYYNEDWQLLVTRKNGDADAMEQYIWDADYVDTPIVRLNDYNTDGTVDADYYYLTDANKNVTAVMNGAYHYVTDAYLYDPYGRPTIYDHTFVKVASSPSANEVMFAGYRYDAELGAYYARNREYHPTAGQWMQRDPAGYVDGGSLSGYVGSRPTAFVDPFGLL